MKNVLAGATAGVAATVPMTMVMETLHERLDGEVPRPLPPREIAEGLAVKFGARTGLMIAAHLAWGAAAGAIVATTTSRT